MTSSASHTAEAADSDTGSSEVATEALLPRVQQLLTRITDVDERKRFECFFSTAAGAIESLGELDLEGNHDFTALSGGPDSDNGDSDNEAAIWEGLAPAIDATLERVKIFLDVVRNQFPIDDAETDSALEFALGPDDALDDAQESDDGGDDEYEIDISIEPVADDPPSEESSALRDVAQTLQAFCSNMDHEIRQLEHNLESTSTMSNGWNLLELLGEFRGRERSGIGEMVFLAARLFAVVRKEDVVPFYKEDVDQSIKLRREIAMLRNRVDVQRGALARLDLKNNIEQARPVLQRFLDELSDFMGQVTFKRMRTADKRSFVEVGNELSEVIDTDGVTATAIDNTIGGLATFLDSLGLMNHRELLLVHDQEAVEQATHYLGSTFKALETDDVDAARTALGRATQGAMRLYGREAVFDGILTLMEHTKPDTLSHDEVLSTALLMRSQL